LSKATSKPARRRILNPSIVWVLVSLVFLALVGSAAWVKANEKAVEITVDGQRITLRTLKKTVDDSLKEARVSLGPYDEVLPARNALLTREQKIAVIRAVQITLIVEGKKSEIYSTKQTVSDVLQANDVSLEAADKVTPDKSAPVTSGMTIEVIRVKENTTQTTARIPFTIVKREDRQLEIGITKVVQEGQEGVKQLTYRDVIENGKKTKSVLVQTKVIKEPVSRILAYGTSGTINRGNETIRFQKAFEMTATAYYPGPESTGKWADGYTKIGLRATFGVVAVDPNVIPLRSRLYIDGYGFAIAADVGGAIKGNRIDLCYDTKAEALKWGRRKTKVYLLN